MEKITHNIGTYAEIVFVVLYQSMIRNGSPIARIAVPNNAYTAEKLLAV